MKHFTVHICVSDSDNVQPTIMASRGLSQERNVLRGMFSNEKWLSSRSIDDEAGHPDPPRLAHYSKPTLIDALDLELPAILEGAITICGHGRVLEFLQVSQET